MDKQRCLILEFYCPSYNRISYLVPLGGLVEHVGSDVLDLVLIEAAAEGRHGVLAVGHLVDDAGLLVATLQVLLQGLLAERLLVLDDVVAAGVASSAVAGEDLGASVKVSGEHGGHGHGTSHGRGGWECVRGLWEDGEGGENVCRKALANYKVGSAVVSDENSYLPMRRATAGFQAETEARARIRKATMTCIVCQREGKGQGS